MAGTITPFGGSAITCDILNCAFPVLKTRVETFVRRGYDGYGVALDAAGDSEFKIKVVKFGTSAQVDTWASDVQACQGQSCEVVNGWGTTVDDILFEKVSPPLKSPAVRHVMDDGCRGEIEIMAKRMS